MSKPIEHIALLMLARLAANGLGTAAQMATVVGKTKDDFLREAAEFYDEAEKVEAWTDMFVPWPVNKVEDEGESDAHQSGEHKVRSDSTLTPGDPEPEPE